MLHPTRSRTAPPLELRLSPRGIYKLGDPSRINDLPPFTQKVARLFDGRRTVAEVCRLAGISETGAFTLVEGLIRRGVIFSTTRLSGFSAFEESFFASEVTAAEEGDDPLEPSWSQRVFGRLLGECGALRTLRGQGAAGVP
jgi:hypothetical protein